MLYLNEKARMFVSHKSSTGQRYKSYDYENNNKYVQKPKIQQKSARKCRSHLNHRHLSENFIYDPLEIFAKPIGTINIGIMQ